MNFTLIVFYSITALSVSLSLSFTQLVAHGFLVFRQKEKKELGHSALVSLRLAYHPHINLAILLRPYRIPIDDDTSCNIRGRILSDTQRH